MTNAWSPITAFPSGVSSFGIPLIGPGGELPVGGNYFFVDSGSGADGNTGGFDQPMATLDAAIGRCTANNGDVIVLMPGHAETVSAASGITCDVAGVYIVGLGEGNNRPTFTFSATAATIVISAASVQFGHKNGAGENSIITKPSIDSVVTALSVTGAGCAVFIEHQDASSTVENVTAVTASATADNLILDVRYVGFTAGNAVVSAIILTGLSNARVNVDFYGKASTSVVDFATTAVIDVVIGGYFYVSGTTDLSKNVTDSATGSTWFVAGYDGAAGASFSGGSAAAVASDDVSTINSKIGTITNTGGTASIGAILGDFANTTLISFLNQLAGAAGVVTYPAAVRAANGVSLAEVLRFISDDQLFQTTTFTQADVTAGTPWNVGTVTLFTVTGVVLLRVLPNITTGFTSTCNNGTVALGTADNASVLIAATTANGTNFATGDVWISNATAKSGLVPQTGNWLLVNADNVVATIGTNNLTAGGINAVCQWVPVSSGATVV